MRSKELRKNAVLTVKSFFRCHDVKWALKLLKKLLFAKQIELLKIKNINVEYFNLGHAYKPTFRIIDWQF